MKSVKYFPSLLNTLSPLQAFNVKNPVRHWPNFSMDFIPTILTDDKIHCRYAEICYIFFVKTSDHRTERKWYGIKFDLKFRFFARALVPLRAVKSSLVKMKQIFLNFAKRNGSSCQIQTVFAINPVFSRDVCVNPETVNPERFKRDWDSVFIRVEENNESGARTMATF